MIKVGTQYEVTYHVLDESGAVVDVIKETGRNRNYIKWRTNRLLPSRYGKGKKFSLKEIKYQLVPE